MSFKSGKNKRLGSINTIVLGSQDMYIDTKLSIQKISISDTAFWPTLTSPKKGNPSN